MSERWFLFLQLEFPWELGPPDGRYLLRAHEHADPEHVVVLGTQGARRAPAARGSRRLAASRGGSRRRVVEPEPEPAAVATSRATIVDPVSVSAERQAKAWLSELDGERDVLDAVAVLNRVLHLHRIAAADAYVREVVPEQALVIRAGWGEGEQVADGVWQHAIELPWSGRGGLRKKRIGDRAAALRPQERLAVMLGGRGASLICEELTLRARVDLDQGRIAHAAIELRGAYAAALSELPLEGREDLLIRIDELRKLSAGVERQATLALAGDRSAEEGGSDGGRIDSSSAPGQRTGAGVLDRTLLRHAIERLEACLRARTAAGFRLK